MRDESSFFLSFFADLQKIGEHLNRFPFFHGELWVRVHTRAGETKDGIVAIKRITAGAT